MNTDSRATPSESFASLQMRLFFGFQASLAVMFFGFIGGTLWVEDGLPPLGVVVGLIGIAIFARAVAIGFRLDDKGVVIRNVFGSQRISWDEIAQIGWQTKSYNQLASWPAVAVKRHDGRIATASATMGYGRPRIEPLVDAVHAFGRRHDVPVELTLGDLWAWGRPGFKGPETAELV